MKLQPFSFSFSFLFTKITHLQSSNSLMIVDEPQSLEHKCM